MPDAVAVEPIALSARAAAIALGISKSTFERACAAGEIEPRWHGGRRLFAMDELRRWFDALPEDKPDLTA